MDSTLNTLLRTAAERGASDLYVKAGCPPTIRVDGITHALPMPPLTGANTEAIITPALRPRDMELLIDEHSVNLARTVEGVGRFRVIVFSQQGTLALVARRIRTEIPTIEGLGLPPVLNWLARQRSGLVLVTGATGSGKSTTLAAMVDHRNRTCPGHIVSIEDPVEYLHRDERSIVTQRELGLDCESYERALQDALRQAPDVLLIGEIRDRNVLEQALTFAETGHLVLSTLHSTNANQTLERILGFFPPDHQAQVMMQLSICIRAIVSQRLLPRKGEEGRVVAMEVLIATQRARELIRAGDSDGLKQLMRMGTDEGMVTFDDALFDLAKQGLITPESALAAADSPADLRLRMRGFQALSVT